MERGDIEIGHIYITILFLATVGAAIGVDKLINAIVRAFKRRLLAKR